MGSRLWLGLALCLGGCTGEEPTESTDPTDETDLPDEDWTAFQRAVAIPELPEGSLPVEGALFDAGFAPRRLVGADRDDFHLGLDFDAPRGTPVVATLDGTVFRVQPTDGNSLSNRVILAHPVPEFTWQGDTIDTVYTFHGHLDRIDVIEDQTVTAGDPIGTVGDSGGVSETHLHFEVRLGTHCSLAFSTANPESGCARSYDPAINPLHLLPLGERGLPNLDRPEEPGFPVWIQTRLADQDWNRVETDLGVVDFDQRDGMDATTGERLDNLEFGWMRIEPDPTAKESGRAAWKLVFPEAPTWIEITDIRGDGARWEDPEGSG